MDRYELLDGLRNVTTLKRLRGCGRWRIEGGQGVEVWSGATADGERVAYLTNVQRCGSPWVCPVCSAKVRQGRAVEIERAALAHLAGGGVLYTAVFTLPHDAVDRLSETWGVLSGGFARVAGGRAWIEDRQRYRVEGYIRAQEVTHGAAGWHPHAHVLLFVAGELAPAERAELADRMHGRWARYVEGQGFRAPARWLCELHPVRDASGLADYLAKAAVVDEGEGPRRLGLEMARADLKEGRGKGRTPWELARAAVGGEEAARVLWREWERSSKGKRSVVWSRGLRALYGVEEATDDELAAAAAETPASRALVIEPGSWDVIARQRGAVDTVLLLVETVGPAAAEGFIRRLVAEHVAACVRSKVRLPERAGLERAPP